MFYPELARPCPLNSDEQRRVRGYCGHCRKHVHDLDPLDAAARRALIEQTGGNLCVAYTRPRSVPRLGVGAALAISLVAAGCSEPAPRPPEQGEWVQVVPVQREVPRRLLMGQPVPLPPAPTPDILVGRPRFPHKQPGTVGPGATATEVPSDGEPQASTPEPDAPRTHDEMMAPGPGAAAPVTDAAPATSEP